MSILNAFVTPELALLGVDTDALTPDGTTYQVCKLITLPQLRRGGYDPITPRSLPSFTSKLLFHAPIVGIIMLCS